MLTDRDFQEARVNPKLRPVFVEDFWKENPNHRVETFEYKWSKSIVNNDLDARLRGEKILTVKTFIPWYSKKGSKNNIEVFPAAFSFLETIDDWNSCLLDHEYFHVEQSYGGKMPHGLIVRLSNKGIKMATRKLHILQAEREVEAYEHQILNLPNRPNCSLPFLNKICVNLDFYRTYLSNNKK